MLGIMLTVISAFTACWSQSISPVDLAASYNLIDTVSFGFPPAPVANDAAGDYVVSNWGTKYIDNRPDLSFIVNPFNASSPRTQNPQAAPSNSTATVLAVNYPAGSFNHDTGGSQFVNTFAPGTGGQSNYQTMVLTYEVAFSENFQFVKGGKLPGLRGGSVTKSCGTGGNPGNGVDCFTVRLMWRTLGSGEGYAYIPTPNGLCLQHGIRCNDDGYGVSIDRATFSFTPGRWTRITMLVQLNDPGFANGVLTVYYNDLLAIRRRDLYYRATNSIANIQGMFFSTFFGGNDNSWASPVSQNTYYRNIQIWGGSAASNITGGARVTGLTDSAPRSTPAALLGVTALVGLAALTFLW